MKSQNLNELLIQAAKLSVRSTTIAGAGHASSALSLAHVVTYLMHHHMQYDPANPWDLHGDRLVLSEGHAVPIAYAAYAQRGGVVGSRNNPRPLTVSDLDRLRERESVLDGHPNPAEGFPFFDAATGSLGMGLSVAAGLGLAALRDGSPRRIYCIVGDGESREGQIWEALDFLVEHEVTNVCTFFNCNGYGQAGAVAAQQSPEALARKAEAFGCRVRTIDGHDFSQIAGALREFNGSGPPLVIVLRTVKGWGVAPLLQGNWHGKPLDESRLAESDASLDEIERKLPAFTAPAVAASPTRHSAPPRVDPREVAWPSFEDCMRAAKLDAALARGALATRRAYAAALATAGEILPQVVVLDGDVSNSTFTELFAARHPRRFFECRIAEQNMISVAVGLSAAGCIPFANSFAKFISRGFDQVELASISRANLKIVGSHAGVSPCSDGPSQMGLVDLAFFRAFTRVRGDDRGNPLCWVFNPCDAVSAFHCTRLMLSLPGMCYMRTYRPDGPIRYAPDASFQPGGCHVLQTGADLTLVSAGFMIGPTLQAAQLLSRRGCRAAVIDAYSLPLNLERLLDALQRGGRSVLVVEDNYGGGLHSAVAELLAESGDGRRVRGAICQRIPKSTRTPEQELEYVGLSPEQIADFALAAAR